MTKRTLLIGGSLLLVSLLGLIPAFAQEPGPEMNPVYATIEYVDQQIAAVLDYVGEEVARLDAKIDAIGGGGGGPDFETPEEWQPMVYHAERRMELRSGWCTWNGVPVEDSEIIDARAIATHNGNVLGYAIGFCGWLQFSDLAYVPEVGETIQVQIWYFWMGTQKTITVPVTIVNQPPQCWGSTWDPMGNLQIRFEAWAVDPEGGELNYLWDFGDGTTAEDGSEQLHTYPSLGSYTFGWTAVDDTGLECEVPYEDIYVMD